MPSIFHKKLSRGRRKRGRHDGKQNQIIDAGIRLLAHKDFEAVSMAKLAREAGCSVGSLYARFPDKNACLYRLVGAAFRSMAESARTELEPQRWRHLPAASRIALVVNHVTTKMTSPRGAGVIRAAVKLATIRPLAGELFEDYRAAVTESAVTLLSGKLGRTTPPNSVRIAMQMLFAALTDAVICKRPGPMVAGGSRMRAALAAIMLGYLGVAKTNRWSGREADGEDEPTEDMFADDPPDSDATFDPDLRAYRKSKTATPDKSRTRPARPVVAGPRVAVQRPAKIPVSSKPSSKPKRSRRKHRFI